MYFHTCPSVHNPGARLRSFLGATDACPPSRLNQTRSRQRQTGKRFSRSSRCVPTYCTCVSGLGRVSVLRHSEQKERPRDQSSRCYFPISSPSNHLEVSSPFSCSVAPPELVWTQTCSLRSVIHQLSATLILRTFTEKQSRKHGGGAEDHDHERAPSAS